MICMCFIFWPCFLHACKCAVVVILSSERSWQFVVERRTEESSDLARRLTVMTAGESTERFVVTLVSRKICRVTSCETKDLLWYFVWVMNFIVWKNHIKTQLNQSIDSATTCLQVSHIYHRVLTFTSTRGQAKNLPDILKSMYTFRYLGERFDFTDGVRTTARAWMQMHEHPHSHGDPCHPDWMNECYEV